VLSVGYGGVQQSAKRRGSGLGYAGDRSPVALNKLMTIN
jgi:hypothetical protein